MPNQSKIILNLSTFFIVILLILTTFVFVNTPGTGDMRFWKQWAINADTYGFAEGFKANGDMYPPLTSVILLSSMRFSRLVGIGLEKSISLSIIGFLFLSSLIFWLWTKDIKITVLMHLSLILGSIALKLIDIYFAPFLILSFWALTHKKYTLFAVMYTISFLIKWQPLIIAPFIALYIINIDSLAQFKLIKIKQIM